MVREVPLEYFARMVSNIRRTIGGNIANSAGLEKAVALSAITPCAISALQRAFSIYRTNAGLNGGLRMNKILWLAPGPFCCAGVVVGTFRGATAPNWRHNVDRWEGLFPSKGDTLRPARHCTTILPAGR